jgi:hypothetical protein
MKTIFAFLLLLPLSLFGQRYSSLTSTNAVTATNLLAVEMFPNATNGTKSISVSNLARSLGPYITNTSTATPAYNGEVSVTNATRIGLVYGKTGDTNLLRSISAGANVVLTNEGTNIVIASTASGAGISTNANQFGPSVELTIKSSPLLTNLNSYGTLTANGVIHGDGGIQLGNVTASRVAIINSANDITNSPAVDLTELEYLDGATNSIQTQINLLKLAVTNLGSILFVHPQGAATGVRGSVPWNNLSNAAIAALGGETIFVLAATNDVLGVTNSGTGGVNITNKVGDITLTGWGMSSYLQSDEEGTAIYANEISGKLTISNLKMRGVRNTNFSSVAETHFLCGIRLGGNLGRVDVHNLYVASFQRFGIGFIQDASDNPYTNFFRAWGNTITNCGTWVPGVARYDGAGLQLAGKTEVWGNDIIATARGIELYGYDAGGTHQRSGPHRIFGNRIRNWLDGAIITGSFTNNQDVAIYGNESIQDLGYSRDTSNALEVAHFQLSVIDGLSVRDNLIVNGRSGIEAFTSAIRPIKPTIVEGNFLYGQHAPLVFGDATSGSSAGMIGLQVRRNFIDSAGGRGLQLIGVRDSIIEGNTFHNVSTNGSLEAIYMAGTATLAHSSNNVIRHNVARDRTGSVGALYGINIAAGSVGTVLDNNQFEDVATAAISDAGTNTFVKNLTTTGQGIGTNSPAARLHVHGRSYVNGTNAAHAFHFAGGQATNSLLYIDGGTNAGVVTIGANLTLTAGTLAASGGSASTNNPVQAAGWLQVTQAISFVGSGGTLVGTNMYYSNTLARAGSLFTNVFAANAGGLTNLLFEIADGSSIDLWIWPSNGVTAQLPQFTASQYAGNPSAVPSISSNAWNRIRVSRLNVQTNVEVFTASLDLGPGNMVRLDTNFASRVVTVGIGNAVLTNLGGTSLEFVAPNIISNVGQINYIVETRLIPTNSSLSNIEVNFATTNSVDLFLTNNATFTNWSGLAEGTSPSKTIWITPQLIPRGINWGSAFGFGVAIRTNVNSPLWTTLTNDKNYVLAITAKGTNLFPTLTLWE